MGFDITGLGSIFDFGSKVIDKIFPDKDAADKAKIEMLKLQQEGAFKELELSFENAKAQIGVNLADAQSGKWYQQWRSLIGWVCGLSLAYNYIIFPFISWVGKWIDPVNCPPMTALDSGELMTLTLGILGLGAYKTYENVKKGS